MSSIAKLIKKIQARPPEAEFDDVRHVLEAFGWILDRERGSHCVFVKDHELPLTIPTKGGRRVKRAYLDEICERLGLDD